MRVILQIINTINTQIMLGNALHSVSMSQSVDIELYAEGSPKFDSLQQRLVSVNLLQICRTGFYISKLARSCICDPTLIPYTNQCNITDDIILDNSFGLDMRINLMN